MEASDDAARLDLRDLVIFAVKAPALASAASAARPMIGADTLIVPMLNGVPWWFLADRGESLSSVDPDGAVASALRLSQVIGCVVHASCATTAPGIVQYISANRIIFGEPTGGASDHPTALTPTFSPPRFPP